MSRKRARCTCYVLPHADDCALLRGITNSGARVFQRPGTFTRAERRLTDDELRRMTREAQENGDGSYPDVEGWPDGA